jgi:hypothetical protein
MSTRRRSTTNEGFPTPFLETFELEETVAVAETPVVTEVLKEVEEVVEEPKPIKIPELIRPRRNVSRFVR